VFDSTDVLVNGQPPFDRLPVERRLVAPRISEPQEVPRRVHEGVHGVGLPARRPSPPRAGGVKESLVGGKRGPPGGHELDVVRQVDREVGRGHRLLATVGAIDDGNWATPVTLSRDTPVFESKINFSLSNLFFF